MLSYKLVVSIILNIASFYFLYHFLFFFPPEKHVLMSPSSESDSETEHSDRKHVHSDSEATEPKPAKMAKLTGVQKSISGFVSGAGSSSSASHTAANVSLHGEKENRHYGHYK